MERKEWNLDEFANGTNRLPEAYHWRVIVDAKRKPVVQISLDPGWGTHVEETGNPSAPIVDIPTSWENLIRLAVQIAHMAQGVGVELPDGILIKVPR
jgi:hypothetical protein